MVNLLTPWPSCNAICLYFLYNITLDTVGDWGEKKHNLIKMNPALKKIRIWPGQENLTGLKRLSI